MSEIEIRKAAASDANLLHVLAGATFYQAYAAQDEAGDLANYIVEAFNLERIAVELADSDSTFFLQFIGKQAIGYAKLRENSTVEAIESTNTIELQRIYLVPHFYNRGAGEKLLAHCVSEAAKRNKQSIWLGVWEENLRARKFYAKHNFHIVGKISFPYGSQIGTNLVLEKRLQTF